MTTDIEAALRHQLDELMAQHEAWVGEIDPADPLAVNTAMRHASSTRTLLRNLRSTAPIGSQVADEIAATELRLDRAGTPGTRAVSTQPD